MQDGHSDILSSFSQTIASWFTDGSATIFFLTPFRVFEFAIGASLVWLVRLKFDSNLAREIMMLIGLSMIGWSIANFDQRTIFPSVNALIPCVGAALVIFSCDAKLCGVVVRNKLSVFLGLISYSVYLVHWPIIVFYKYYSVVKISMAEKLLLIVLSLLLGYFLYRFVETPFRLRGNGQHVSKSEFWLACMSLIMLLSLPSATVWANNGWPWRVPPLPSDIAGQIKNSKQFHVDEYGGAGFPYNTGWIGPDKKGVADIVLIGDSHAGQLKTGLSEAIANKHQLSIYYSIAGCLALPEITRIDGGADWDKVCYVALRDALNVLQNSPNATVLIAESWGFEVMKGGRLGSNIPLFDGQNLKLAFQGIRPDLNKLKSLIGERRLVIVGDVPGAGVTDTIGCFSRPKYLYIDCESILTTPRENNLANISNEFLGLYASQNRNVEFINPFDYLCDEKRCRSLVGGKVLYSDGYHLSKAGSRLIVSAFEKKLLGS